MNEKNLRIGDVMAYRDGKSIISKAIRWGTSSHYSHIARILGDKKTVLEVLDQMIEGLEKVMKENGGLMRFSSGNQKLELEKTREEVLKMPDGWIVIESDFSHKKIIGKLFGKFKDYQSGVKIQSLAKVRTRSGSHDIFRTQYTHNLSSKRFISHALATMAKRPKYDFLGLLWQAVVAARMKFLKRKTNISVENIHKFYCSEFSKFLDRLWGIPQFVRNFEGIPPSKTTPESESKREDYNFEFNLLSKKNA